MIGATTRKTTTGLPPFEIRRAGDRGAANFGWLDTRHTFSFGQYFDPAQVGFSDLLVINDDRIAAGAGFPTHPHANMEIFTYVLSGAVAHKDSMGTGSVIRPGDIQVMSAGTGVRHSEFNPSPTEPLHLLQIWIVPDRKGVAPRYQQKRFAPEEKRGRLRLVLSPDGAGGSLEIHQDAKVYAGLLDGTERITHVVPDGRSAYVHVARGRLTLNGQALEAGDGVRVREPMALELADGKDAEVLVFDLRKGELPELVR